jgi:predicted amidohydrolase YtcJ
VAEAVAAYTSNNAYGSFLENEMGTIEAGKYADLVVLSDDIFTIDPVEIERVQVEMTLVEGEVVFDRSER